MNTEMPKEILSFQAIEDKFTSHSLKIKVEEDISLIKIITFYNYQEIAINIFQGIMV